ncbi:Phosphoserine aminotransferase 1 [Hibiscus syriacus]|uniref:phosphoserine transaminase n=1 Tax=Hibiscus syriacus TaxID=106335 RepID=A0A6A3AAX5_HIBSY|nr:Phosphoserine aminotransferase 1 [Hibiscus syriacus]
MAATPLTNPHTPLLQKTHQSHAFLKPKTTFHYGTSSKPFSISCSSTIQGRPSLRSHSQDRIFNFAAGPATLPENVLLKAQAELYNWRGSGMSVMEMSHRGKDFRSIIEKAEADLRALLNIPEDYAVLFLQGGATTQFASVPLNLCQPDDAVDYLVTGSWGDKAFKEAKKYCKPKVVWNGKSENYVRVPSFDGLELSPNAKYLHLCANETIYGVEFKNYPVPGNPNGVLVADMSSNFCSKPFDVTKFGLIYAGAQKNVGPSGVCIVIVRKYLIGNAQEITPGGLKEVEKKNERKAGVLYNAIDESKGFYRCPVEKSVRSLMNVPFTLEKSELEGEFLKEAEKEKMVQLKGHRSVGGMRASIYNAMSLAGVEKLVSFHEGFPGKAYLIHDSLYITAIVLLCLCTHFMFLLWFDFGRT